MFEAVPNVSYFEHFMFIPYLVELCYLNRDDLAKRHRWL